MEESILICTKKLLGLAEDYTVFDLDIILFINSALAVASQAGIGLAPVIAIEDDQAEWGDLELSPENLAMLKTYIYLKARMMFDPPQTSFVIEAMNSQIAQLEWRMNVNQENYLHPEGETV